ncbi:DUF3108 domain-containing protein [Candidatus Electrothrix sp.]|uniref:DUF3108 domain-containing protein n=2 Tax=Candidatus Electrothrix sp. TaxID=2170559 RepID=UPI00405644DB
MNKRSKRSKEISGIFLSLLLSLTILSAISHSLYAGEAEKSRQEPLFSLDSQAQPVVFSGQEKMHFSVSWSGGVKIGDLVLTLSPHSAGQGLVIKARVTDYGLFHFFYPVDDTFTTLIRKPWMLPHRYEVHQREGSREIHRLTLYEQEQGKVWYRKHQDPLTLSQVAGPVYNEFSAFFITRVLDFQSNKEQVIPAFVDKEQHKVAVKILGREKKESILGQRKTIKVMPEMHFKGLYEKDGDTVFWLTDDACRIPVEIRSKILIGSLVAELVAYSNPACQTVSAPQGNKE